jgi:hypothetical protein
MLFNKSVYLIVQTVIIVVDNEPGEPMLLESNEKRRFAA